MKRNLLSLGAVLSFGIALAQTTPPATQPPTGGEPVKTEVMEQDKREMKTTPDAVTVPAPQSAPDSRPAGVKEGSGQPVSPDHVKSTPHVERAGDTTATRKAKKARRS